LNRIDNISVGLSHLPNHAPATVPFKYGQTLALYNLELCSDSMDGSVGDDFEGKILEEMARMFSEMGMPVDVELLQNMMRQVREQFEAMGIDPEQMASTDIRMGIDSNPEEFRKQMEAMLNGPGGMADIFRNMGIDVKFQSGSISEPTPEVEVSEEVEKDEDKSKLLLEDVFIHEDRMCATIDISRFIDLEAEEIELNLTSGGEVLQLMKTTQLHPLKRYTLPHIADNIVEWDLNNGILDVKFDIEPATVAADESE